MGDNDKNMILGEPSSQERGKASLDAWPDSRCSNLRDSSIIVAAVHDDAVTMAAKLTSSSDG